MSAARTLHNRALAGVICMLLGLALYPLSDAFIKHLMEIYTVRQVIFLRAFTRTVPLIILVFFQGGLRQVFSTQNRKQHATRLLVNLAYTFAFMYAFSLGSLTTIYTISYTSALFMTLLSALILKERISRKKWIAVVFGMIGVIIAMRPGAGLFEWTALIVLVGTFLGALNKILMRRLAETEHSLAIALYPNLTVLCITFPYIVSHWQAMPWEHWGLFCIVGIIAAGAQYAIAQALRFAQGSTLAPIDYSTFLWVIMLDYVWWGKLPHWLEILGAGAIMSSTFFVFYFTRLERHAKKIPMAP